MKVKLLDCTLRDGGFVNEWQFGHMRLINIYLRLAAAGIDIIELGFLSDAYAFDINRSIMPRTEDFNQIFDVKPDPSPMLVGMVILGECPTTHIGKAEDTILDGIRVVFKKGNLTEGLDYCEQVVKKGYKLFIQPASVMDYTIQEFEELAVKVNGLNPYAVSIVDSYGLMHEENMMGYFNALNDYLHEDVIIGYHAHNNFNLAYANAIALVNAQNERDIILDGSLYGMGKGAGNGSIELLAYWLNTHRGSGYDVAQLLEIINLDIMEIRRKYEWGYSFDKFISASNQCHPKYVDYLLSQNTLTVTAVNEILAQIPSEKKTIYDEQTITALLDKHLTQGGKLQKDFNRLASELKGRELLILCPGKKLFEQKQKVDAYIAAHHPLVVYANFFTEAFDCDYILVSNAKRYSQMYYYLKKRGTQKKIIAVTHVTDIGNTVDFMLNGEEFRFDDEEVRFNAALVMLRLLIKIGNTHVAVAGFDGYNEGDDHKEVYIGQHFDFDKAVDGEKINRAVKKELKVLQKQIKVTYITDSLYQNN